MHVADRLDIGAGCIHGIRIGLDQVSGIDAETGATGVEFVHHPVKLFACLDKGVEMRVVDRLDAELPGDTADFLERAAEGLVVFGRVLAGDRLRRAAAHDQNRRAEARQDAGDGFECITLPRPHLRIGEGAVAIEGGEADALFALCLRKRRHTTQEGCVGNDLGRLLRTQIHVFSGKNVGQGIPGQDFEPFEILALQEFQRG